ncbi:hypothetical protein SLE2022_011870 [Rubroshorea leprosula]
MVQQRKPKRWPPFRRSIEHTVDDTPITSISKAQAQFPASKIVATSDPQDSKNNKFVVMAELMEEDTEPPNSNEAIGAGNSFNSKDSVGPIMPVDFVPTGPPLALSTNFIKPKPKQRKSKIGGPVPKELKPLTSKPYQLPQILKKQQESCSQLSQHSTTESGESMAANQNAVNSVTNYNALPCPLPLPTTTNQNQRQVLAPEDPPIMIKMHPPKVIGPTQLTPTSHSQ